jgi:restriction endonuclease S subunit
MFSSYQTTPVGNYIEDSYPGEWGTEDKDGNGVKVVRTTNFTNSGKLDLTDVVTRSISEKKIERKTIRKYDTILERSGGTTDNPVGRVVLFEEDEQYLCNNFTQVLRFKKVNPIFAFYSLFYFYHTNKIVVRSMGSKTTGIQNLNMSKYLEIGIPNASDDEQKKFVAIAKQADKSKFGDFKSQFIDMFKNIPSVKIADCCITVSGGTPNTKKIEYYDGGDIPWLSSGEINQGYIFSTDKYITQLGLENSSAKWVPANSVVIAMYGATAGKVGFIKIPLTTNQAVCTLLPNDGFEPLYLYYATLSKTSWMISQCRGAAQPNISQSIIRSMEIPMATIDEQKQFCKLLTQADKSKSYVRIALKNLESILGYCIRQVA